MVSQKIKQIMKMKKVTNVQVAGYLGTSPQALANKFSRETLSADEMISILEFLGCRIVVETIPDIVVQFNTGDLKREP